MIMVANRKIEPSTEDKTVVVEDTESKKFALTMRDVMKEAIAVQQNLDDAKDGKTAVSQHLMVCAKRFVDGKTGKLDVDMFLKACELEQKWAKSAEAGELRVDRIPDCWMQAKSNIKQAAVNFDISPAEHKTESSLRKALNEARKEAKQAAIENVAAEVQDEKLVARKVSTDIAGVLSAISSIYNSLDDDEKKDALKADLIKVHAKYREVFKQIVKGNINKPKNPVAPARDNAGKIIDNDDNQPLVAEQA